ncbi:hypothetical protein [Thermococcus sp.]|uniref:hypothetical protein n=1 Tax=Thermococcus sp. TaxID=35749 RepID=UPI00261AA013|nr:hypothetical protein [Thermococcus sp.]
MVRLADIPAPVLAQIEEFVEENWGKMPVVSKFTDKTLQAEIERRWGYKLSPAQIRRLKYKTVRLSNVYISLDHARELERQYGSVATGVKKAVAKLIAEIPKIPEPYDRAYDYLRGRDYDIQELMERIRELGYEDPQEVLKVFSREGVMMWENGRVKILNRRRLTDLEKLGFLGFGV